MVRGIEELSEDERKALRGSKFAPLPAQPSSSSSRPQPRIAHPGGPVTTNKATALAKFLARKVQEPGGLESINPDLIMSAVKNAKETVHASQASDSGRTIRLVASFDDCEVPMDVGDSSNLKQKKRKKESKRKKPKKKKKNKKMKEDAH
ncbi:hypothetical protein Ancab_039928 [Ancistrocladus abbreviatus]